MTTIQELIDDLLEIEDKSLQVIMSKDAEGNLYSPYCGEYSIAHYISNSAWSGELADEDEDPDLHDEPNAIVLWPVN